jgi:hypothetical protein
MRKEYTKPTVTSVGLVPEEAVLSGCKSGFFGGLQSNICWQGGWDFSCHACGS